MFKVKVRCDVNGCNCYRTNEKFTTLAKMVDSPVVVVTPTKKGRRAATVEGKLQAEALNTLTGRDFLDSADITALRTLGITVIVHRGVINYEYLP